MDGVKTNITLDGAGIICLGIGVSLAQKGEYSWGAVFLAVGGGLLALKYHLRE